MSYHLLILLIGVTLIQGHLSFSPIEVPDSEWESYNNQLRDPAFRLPTTTIPNHYEVELTPYFLDAPNGTQPFSFDGEVSIYISPTVENVAEIVMHCDDIIISSVTVELNGVFINVAGQTYACEMPFAFLRIPTTQPLQIGSEYKVNIVFSGRLQTNMRGFYRSWYTDSTGLRWMGTTQFQPGHARQAFPCYDEPGFKATFDITIVREEDFSPTLSNMPIRSMSYDPLNGRVAETFYTTPKTSTYLLAFIVSHYNQVATNNDVVRPFHIYARDNSGTTGNWALQIGELLLEAMEEYTQFPYYNMTSNMSMKQAAIPDFSAGAMENWGLLTYREALILFDPLNSNAFYRQRVANIVSHEIAHMWFGNLVTCAWWDNLWLNEGFARFYQYYLTGSVAPELGYATRFIVEQLQVSMFSDSVDTAHALTDPSVNDPSAVSAHFSTITYAKGASVLRMTQHLLGEDTYLKALRSYLQDRQFNVAEPEHLFEALERAAEEDNALAGYNGITISDYFPTWTEKAGHPLLTVVTNQQTGMIIVTQSRWERSTGTSSQQGLWHVPITWTRGNDVDFQNLKPKQILTAQTTVLDRGSNGLEWVIFNVQQTGFYRVNYDETNWALITQALRSSARTSIHEYNRAQIVDDSFALARAGARTYTRVLNVLSFLKEEDEYAPWVAAVSGFAFVIRRLAHDQTNRQTLNENIIELSEALTARLGYSEIPNESYMDGLLRMYVMEFLCNAGHQECISAGRGHFVNWRTSNTFIPPNMRPWVYCVGLREGDDSDFDFFWDRYLAEDLASEKVVMLSAAGCTRSRTSIEKYLNEIVMVDEETDTQHVRIQDASAALSAVVSGNEENTMIVFEWLKDHIVEVERVFGSLATPLSYVAARLLNDEQFNNYEQWIQSRCELMGALCTSALNNLQSAKNNIEWSTRRMPELAAYFETGYVEDILDGGETDNVTPDGVEPEESEETEDEDDSATVSTVSILTIAVALSINLAI